MKNIDVPKPMMTAYGRANFATECAFTELLQQAKDAGLQVAPVMGLMYLPTQELTAQFQQACRAILLALTPPETQVTGSDGKQYFISQDGEQSIPE